MNKLTRKELKTNTFALEVGHGVEYVTGHRMQLIRYGAIALGVIAVVLGIYWYVGYERGIRQDALAGALRIMNANVGVAPNQYILNFSTNEEKDAAAIKAFTGVATRYPGNSEGVIAQYYLASMAADHGDVAQASRRYKLVIDSGETEYAALAKIALAQIYQGEGKVAEGEKLIQSVIDHPTVLISKEAAIIALARLLAPTDPGRARKLLEPLRANTRSAVSRTALTALGQLQDK